MHTPAPKPSLNLNRPTTNLVVHQTFKQRFGVAFTKAFVGYTLDEFKEHGAQQGLADDL